MSYRSLVSCSQEQFVQMALIVSIVFAVILRTIYALHLLHMESEHIKDLCGQIRVLFFKIFLYTAFLELYKLEDTYWE